jgi:hypothetical protein
MSESRSDAPSALAERPDVSKVWALPQLPFDSVTTKAWS